MSIIRVKKDKNYFAASNEPFNDSNLSWEARGVMGYLLSKPDDWQVVFYDLVKQSPAGEYKVRSILKELEERGYLERSKRKAEDGKFFWVSTIYETISRLPTYGAPTHGSPTGGLPTDGKPRDIVSTESTSTELISTDKPSTETEEEDNIFTLYHSSMGLLTKNITDELITLEDDYPKMWITDAFAIAKKNKAKSLKYVTSILSRWNANGKDDGYKPKGKKKTVDMSAFDRRRAREKS